MCHVCKRKLDSTRIVFVARFKSGSFEGFFLVGLLKGLIIDNLYIFLYFYYSTFANENRLCLRLHVLSLGTKISSDRDLFLVIDTSNIFLVISLAVRADNTVEDDRFDSVKLRRLLFGILFPYIRVTYILPR